MIMDVTGSYFTVLLIEATTHLSIAEITNTSTTLGMVVDVT